MTCARSRIQQIADEAVAGLRAAGPPADLVTEVAAVVPRRVIAELMGVTPEHLTRFYELAARFMDRTLTVTERDATVIAMRQNMDALVEHKRKHPGDDILSHEIDRHLAEPAPFPVTRLRIRRGDGVIPPASPPTATPPCSTGPTNWSLIAGQIHT